ncbi:hypothetical protein BBP40_012374 [Aspergillus hancockii]|nr:hypothetical protein BBP40_012374 [Aspergillus hancockii]
MSGINPSTRLFKRSRATDAPQDNMIRTERERTKRRRTSRSKDEIKQTLETTVAQVPKEMSDHHRLVHSANCSLPHSVDQEKSAAPKIWSLSTPVAGQYTNVDPILTHDEEYLIVGLDAAVHVYSVATSCLFRTLQLKPNQSIIGYNISSVNQEHLFIFTSAGGISKWDWLSGKQVSHWSIGCKLISGELCAQAREDGIDLTLLALRERKDGKREVVVVRLSEEKPHETIILETTTRLDKLKCTHDGRAVVAYGGQRVYTGTQFPRQSSVVSMQYTWREVISPVNINCVDIRPSAALSRAGASSLNNRNGLVGIDLVLGGSDGSILIYHGIVHIAGSGVHHESGKTLTPRRLHWHREPVNVVRWSRDGNYVISGGHESVMVLWQLDTGRKQFLPHLSSPICNIVVSATGNSYVIKLADNSIIALSARELQPFATITGLQSYSHTNKSKIGMYLPSTAAAVLHPQNPDRLLVTVPASRQVTHEGHHLTNSCVLQTYDIRSNNHISRQALARTNATTLRIGPEGSQIIAPSVTHLGVSHDGRWMSTVDKWSPHPHDVEALDSNGGCVDSIVAEHQEIFLKFWRWNNSSGLWELVTRIDAPHFSDKGPVSILDLASRPLSHEFATIGRDAVLRFWCPSIRHRSGLKMEHSEVLLETWKCRNTIDLKGYINNDSSGHLGAASITFSRDGSVLAVCLESVNSENAGLAILVDVQSCTVHYSRVGVYPGGPCMARFLGCHLVVASNQSVSIWDTVDDIVRTPGPLEEADCPYSGKVHRLLAVDSSTQTFAVTLQHLQNNAASKKGRRCYVRVYDIHSLTLLGQLPMREFPLALLPDAQSGDYIVMDTAANVQRLGCNNKSRQTFKSQDWVARINSGIADLLGSRAYDTRDRNTSQALVASSELENSSTQGKDLAAIFGDSSFVLPSANILFQDVVRAFTA